jgi:formylglycine-generating enzyme required for sulfatase activity
VPRTSIINAINKEQKFQREGLTNAENIKELGKRLNAEYVLSGSITVVGGKKLLIISIIHVEYLQQIAGAYKEYQKIEDVDQFLPEMAKQVAAATKINTRSLRELSVVPIQSITGKVNPQDAEVLTQILAIEIAGSGKFAVFPRTKSIEQVMKEHDEQRTGNTDQSSTKRLGVGENPNYVLSINVRSLGAKNMFTAAILSVEESSQGETGRADYQSIEDGIGLMKTLARQLTGGAVPEAAVSPAPKQPAAPAIPANFVQIRAGSFTMGSPASEVDRNSSETQHQVTFSKPFYIGKYEVTQAEYEAVMGTNPSYFKGGNLPVEQVSWYDAIEYCNKRSEKEGLTPAYTISKGWADSNNTSESDDLKWVVTWNKNANGYRLPTEAEWEYACRAGTGTPFHTGGNITTSQANYNGNYPYNNNSKGTYREKTWVVGSGAPNAAGLYDMSGNVWEWCWDGYGGYSSGAQTDPAGASSGSYRVVRGGCWYSHAQGVRSACRGRGDPAGRYSDLGFRLVRPSLP